MPMVKLQELDFLGCGGDPTWLKHGIAASTLPPKLYALMELNELLAHQPWLITAEKMEKLLTLQSSKDATWNVGELVHAIGIMVTFHAICGVVWGLGITPELDISEKFVVSDATVPEQTAEFATDTNRIFNMLKTAPTNFSKQRQSWMESVTEKKNSIWAQTEDENTKLTLGSGSIGSEDCAKYIGSFGMEYNDFDVTSNQYSIFYKALYNWDNDGYALVDQFLDGFAPLLGSELHHIRALTYNSFANVGSVDTTAFREAIWHYAHRIKGLLDDDYNYAEVNQLLNRQMKYYVKKLTCFPQTVTMTDFLNLGIDLQPSEKCHIALLATEASKEASITYALKALSAYLKK